MAKAKQGRSAGVVATNRSRRVHATRPPGSKKGGGSFAQQKPKGNPRKNRGKKK